MSSFKIEYKYYEGWCSYDKEGYHEYSYEEALKRYNKNETVFVVATIENKNKPFALIMLSGRPLYISFLNEKLDEEREYRYYVLDNINTKKVFLVEVIIREYDYDNGLLIRNIKKAHTYEFATSNKDSDFKWLLLDKVYCVDTDYIKEERISYESKNIIDEKSLWEDIPTFGNWDNILREDRDRVKFIEIND